MIIKTYEEEKYYMAVAAVVVPVISSGSFQKLLSLLKNQPFTHSFMVVQLRVKRLATKKLIVKTFYVIT